MANRQREATSADQVVTRPRSLIPSISRHSARVPTHANRTQDPSRAQQGDSKYVFRQIIADYTDLTTDRDSKPYKQLLEAIFKPPQAGPIDLVAERSRNWLYDNDSDVRQVATEVWSAVIVQRLRDLCHRHGAQETYLPVLIPETKLLDPYAQDNCVRLLDREGQLVQMVACDLVAMARSAPRRHVGRRKRFHLGTELHPAPSGRQPARATTLR